VTKKQAKGLSKVKRASGTYEAWGGGVATLYFKKEKNNMGGEDMGIKGYHLSGETTGQERPTIPLL